MSRGSADELAPVPQEQATRPSDLVVPHLNDHGKFMGLSGSALRAAIGLAAGLCFLAFGYGQGDIGGYMLTTNFRNEFPQMDVWKYPEFHVAETAGAVVAAWNLGCIVGAVCSIFLSNVIGRKRSIILGLLIEISGKIIQASSFNFGQYIFGRVFAGIGNG
jgi:MFS family permease